VNNLGAVATRGRLHFLIKGLGIMEENKKPETHQVEDLGNLPCALDPLKERPQWAIWNWELRKDKQNKPNWTKPPYQATHPDLHVSITKPATWASYDSAVTAARAELIDGITFVMTPGDGFAAIDLDDCRDPETGNIAPWAQRFSAVSTHETDWVG
jgi:hypothetical protein